MNDPDLFFVVPTYRLRDVGETIKQYDEHFWRNGQSVRLLVLDDSSPANHDKYYPLLEQTRTHNDLFYVGKLLLCRLFQVRHKIRGGSINCAWGRVRLVS